MSDGKPIYKWFVYCANCGQELVIMTAPRDFGPSTPNQSWQGTCPQCGLTYTYQPNQMHVGEE